MARPDSASSIELERSMNMQVRVTTFEEHLEYTKVIDELDDERREKAFNLDRRTEYKLDNFISQLNTILEDKEVILDSEVENSLECLLASIEDYRKQYIKQKSKNHELELHYDNLEDKTRNWLLNYAIECREKLKIENSCIEKKLIKENLQKKGGG